MRRIAYILLVTACSGGQEAPTTPEPVVVAVPETTREPEVEDEDEEGFCEVACKEDGLCAIDEGSCVALEDGHCAQSRACKEENRCAANGRVCVDVVKHRIGACDHMMERIRRCPAFVGAGARGAMEEMVRAMEESLKSADDDAHRQALEQACQTMMQTLEQACPP